MSVNWAELYENLTAQLSSGASLSFRQGLFVNFYRAFVEGDRWKLYGKGVLTTVEVTLLALILGIILGILVAVIRTAHDQQRPGRHNPLLGFLNGVCRIYTTVIRGTPMSISVLFFPRRRKNSSAAQRSGTPSPIASGGGTMPSKSR